VQFNVVTAETLRQAQAKPEEHRDLIVRVAGYSDYFCDLSRELQDEIIARRNMRRYSGRHTPCAVRQGTGFSNVADGTRSVPATLERTSWRSLLLSSACCGCCGNEEPDRIPHFEWIIDHHVRRGDHPGCSVEEFTVRMGLDAILTGPDFRKQQIGEKRYRNEWGVVTEYTGEEHSYPVEGPIKSREDFQHYTPPDPHAPGRYASLDRLVKKYKGKLAIGVHLNDVFSIPAT